MTYPSNVRYLAISDLYSIGQEKRREDQESESVGHSPLRHDHEKKRKRSAESNPDEAGDEVPPNKLARSDGRSTLNAEFERDPPLYNKWLATAAAEHHKLCHGSAQEAGRVSCHAFTPYAQKAMKAGKPLQPVSRRLRLSTLASVTGVNASRNRTVDILALIDSIDDHTIKRKDIPLYRDIHIADPSTERIVTLSVFIDPVDFVPRKDEIALFRSVTTHEYKSGKLNAYPQHCEGKDWYIPDPRCIKGCENELKAMEAFREQYKRRS